MVKIIIVGVVYGGCEMVNGLLVVNMDNEIYWYEYG